MTMMTANYQQEVESVSPPSNYLTPSKCDEKKLPGNSQVSDSRELFEQIDLSTDVSLVKQIMTPRSHRKKSVDRQRRNPRRTHNDPLNRTWHGSGISKSPKVDKDSRVRRSKQNKTNPLDGTWHGSDISKSEKVDSALCKGKRPVKSPPPPRNRVAPEKDKTKPKDFLSSSLHGRTPDRARSRTLTAGRRKRLVEALAEGEKPKQVQSSACDSNLIIAGSSTKSENDASGNRKEATKDSSGESETRNTPTQLKGKTSLHISHVSARTRAERRSGDLSSSRHSRGGSRSARRGGRRRSKSPDDPSSSTSRSGSLERKRSSIRDDRPSKGTQNITQEEVPGVIGSLTSPDDRRMRKGAASKLSRLEEGPTYQGKLKSGEPTEGKGGRGSRSSSRGRGRRLIAEQNKTISDSDPDEKANIAPGAPAIKRRSMLKDNPSKASDGPIDKQVENPIGQKSRSHSSSRGRRKKSSEPSKQRKLKKENDEQGSEEPNTNATEMKSSSAEGVPVFTKDWDGPGASKEDQNEIGDFTLSEMADFSKSVISFGTLEDWGSFQPKSTIVVLDKKKAQALAKRCQNKEEKESPKKTKTPKAKPKTMMVAKEKDKEKSPKKKSKAKAKTDKGEGSKLRPERGEPAESGNARLQSIILSPIQASRRSSLDNSVCSKLSKSALRNSKRRASLDCATNPIGESRSPRKIKFIPKSAMNKSSKNK
jgi:hypothetical protein